MTAEQPQWLEFRFTHIDPRRRFGKLPHLILSPPSICLLSCPKISHNFLYLIEEIELESEMNGHKNQKVTIPTHNPKPPSAIDFRSINICYATASRGGRNGPAPWRCLETQKLRIFRKNSFVWAKFLLPSAERLVLGSQHLKG